jgi:histidinol-phosphate phosphatase family protein
MPGAVFIDKDGTLVRDIPYNIDPSRIELTQHAGTALRRLRNAGYKIIVISNQPGIALNLFNERDLLPVNRRIQDLLWSYEVEIDAFYYCPHEPADYCACRKPLPGMILRAAREQGVETAISWMIGDILNDVEAGNRAGCRTIHLDNGNETEWMKGDYRQPGWTVQDLPTAAEVICSGSARPSEMAGKEATGDGRRGGPAMCSATSARASMSLMSPKGKSLEGTEK